jgi:hypothetical protein
MISRPGLRVGMGQAEGLEAASIELARFAARPLMLAISLALVIALFMRETHPARRT